LSHKNPVLLFRCEVDPENFSIKVVAQRAILKGEQVDGNSEIA